MRTIDRFNILERKGNVGAGTVVFSSKEDWILIG